MHLLFYAHFMNIFSFLFLSIYFFSGRGGQFVEFRHFPSEMHRWCLVCEICNSNSFHSSHNDIHTLNIILSYQGFCRKVDTTKPSLVKMTENVHLLFLCTFNKYHLFFEGF